MSLPKLSFLANRQKRLIDFLAECQHVVKEVSNRTENKVTMQFLDGVDDKIAVEFKVNIDGHYNASEKATFILLFEARKMYKLNNSELPLERNAKYFAFQVIINKDNFSSLIAFVDQIPNIISPIIPTSGACC